MGTASAIFARNLVPLSLIAMSWYMMANNIDKWVWIMVLGVVTSYLPSTIKTDTEK